MNANFPAVEHSKRWKIIAASLKGNQILYILIAGGALELNFLINESDTPTRWLSLKLMIL